MRHKRKFVGIFSILFTAVLFIFSTVANAETCVPPPSSCSLNGSVSISVSDGRTLVGMISGSLISFNYPGAGTLHGSINTSMGTFTVSDPVSGQTLHGTISNTGCSQSDIIAAQATYDSCIAISGAQSNSANLNELIGASAANDINCMKQGAWFTYDEKSHSCIDTKSSELSQACTYDSNYGPNSYYDLSKSECVCHSGYTLKYNSSIEKLRCVVPPVIATKPAILKANLTVPSLPVNVSPVPTVPPAVEAAILVPKADPVDFIKIKSNPTKVQIKNQHKKVDENLVASTSSNTIPVATSSQGMTPAEAPTWINAPVAPAHTQKHWYEWLYSVNWFYWFQ